MTEQSAPLMSIEDVKAKFDESEVAVFTVATKNGDTQVAFKKPGYQVYKQFQQRVLQYRDSNPAGLVGVQEWLVQTCCVTHDKKGLEALLDASPALCERAAEDIIALTKLGVVSEKKG